MTKWQQVADVLDRLGWNKGDFQNSDTGSVCLLGACGVAWHDDPHYFRGFTGTGEDRYLLEQLTQSMRESGISYRRNNQMPVVQEVVNFNDNSFRTVDEILSVVKKLTTQEN